METPPRLYNPRFVLLLSLQFVFGLGFSSFFLLPKYLTEVHAANATVIGLVVAAGPVAAVSAIPLLARHIDRLPLRWLMVGGALAMFTTSLGFAPLMAPGPAMFLFRALQGAGFVVFFASTTVLASTLSPPERLGQAVGLLGAANLATNAVAPALAEIVASSYGWRPVFLASALCSLLAASGALVLPTHRPALSEPSSAAPSPTPIWQPRFLRLLYAGAMVGASFGTVVTYYQPLALELGIRDVRDLFLGYTASALLVRVLLGGRRARAGRGVGKQHGDVAGPDLAAVDAEDRALLAHDAARDLQRVGVVVRRRRLAIVVVDEDGDFRMVARRTVGVAGEDHVVHLGGAHGLVGGLAHDPAHRLDKVRLAAAVGADDPGQARFDRKVGRFDEGFEADQAQPRELHSGLVSISLAAAVKGIARGSRPSARSK